MKTIRPQYRFDHEAALTWLTESTLALIKEQEPAATPPRKDHLQETLRAILFILNPPDADIMEVFERAGGKKREMLVRIFQSKRALRLLQNLFKTAFLDARTFRRIESPTLLELPHTSTALLPPIIQRVIGSAEENSQFVLRRPQEDFDYILWTEKTEALHASSLSR